MPTYSDWWAPSSHRLQHPSRWRRWTLTEHPQLEVSTYHLAQYVKSGYEGMLIAVPAEHWPSAAGQTVQSLAERLLRLARRILPRQVATSKRGPKIDKPKGYVHASIARSHDPTARVLKQARTGRP